MCRLFRIKMSSLGFPLRTTKRCADFSGLKCPVWVTFNRLQSTGPLHFQCTVKSAHTNAGKITAYSKSHPTLLNTSAPADKEGGMQGKKGRRMKAVKEPTDHTTLLWNINCNTVNRNHHSTLRWSILMITIPHADTKSRTLQLPFYPD